MVFIAQIIVLRIKSRKTSNRKKILFNLKLNIFPIEKTQSWKTKLFQLVPTSEKYFPHRYAN